MTAFRWGILVAGLCISLCGCQRGAERVNVPLSVSMRLTGTPASDCHRSVCAVHFEATVTDEGTRPVFARDCVVRALDRHGLVVLEAGFFNQVGPGGYTEPGHPAHTSETLAPIGEHTVTPSQRARISSLEGTCLAYIWHGPAPI
jgi:hypothetical protein